MTMRKPRWVACTYVAAALATACTGDIKVAGSSGGPGSGAFGANGSNGPGGPGSAGPGGAGTGAPGSGSDDPGSDDGSGLSPGEFAPAAAAIRKLSVIQYQNSVRALIAPDVELTVVLEPDTQLNGF